MKAKQLADYLKRLQNKYRAVACHEDFDALLVSRCLRILCSAANKQHRRKSGQTLYNIPARKTMARPKATFFFP